MNTATAAIPEGFRAALVRDNQGSLYRFWIDFFLVGGGSLIFLIAAVLFAPARTPPVALIAFYLTFIANDPHFSSSYILLYRDLPRMVFGEGIKTATRLRYLWAGVVMPLVLIMFCAHTFLTKNILYLAQIVNLMYFFVGWHYIKQGYGVLITFSVLSRIFYSNFEKWILRGNLYFVWATAWFLANQSLQSTDFFGMRVYNVHSYFSLSPAYTHIAFIAMVLSTLCAMGVFVRKYLRDGRLPSINGLMGYVMSSYGWLILVLSNPFYLLFTPLFHSLQYLALVLRYESNRTGEAPTRERVARFLTKGLLKFAVTALVLGYLMFHLIPQGLEYYVPYDKAVFGVSIFSFMIIAFINIHHYFIDNVIWRKDNENVRKYLFAPPKAR